MDEVTAGYRPSHVLGCVVVISPNRLFYSYVLLAVTSTWVPISPHHHRPSCPKSLHRRHPLTLTPICSSGTKSSSLWVGFNSSVASTYLTLVVPPHSTPCRPLGTFVISAGRPLVGRKELMGLWQGMARVELRMERVAGSEGPAARLFPLPVSAQLQLSPLANQQGLSHQRASGQIRDDSRLRKGQRTRKWESFANYSHPLKPQSVSPLGDGWQCKLPEDFGSPSCLPSPPRLLFSDSVVSI